MHHDASNPTLDPSTVEESRIFLTIHLLRLTGGDTALTTQIRGRMWAEYCYAGAPLGVSEDAMYVWWADALGVPMA